MAESYKEKFKNEDGVWRTIGGRRVFIKKGQSLSDAMIESGKFKNDLRSSYVKAKEEKKGSVKDKIDFMEATRELMDADHGDWNNMNQQERTEMCEKILGDFEEKYGTLEDEDFRKKLVDQLEEENFHTMANVIDNKYGEVEENSNWRDLIKANNEQLEKDLKEYQDTHDMASDSDGYYELFRENERKNAGIKQEKPDEPYEFVEAYATYKEKRNKLEGIEKDELGNPNYDTMKDATWTGKEYTNDEFLENLEDENWHTERKMLLDAGLTNKQMEFVKDNTEFHNGSPSLDKEITEELIKGAKGEPYKTPQEIKANRNAIEIESLQKELDTISKYGVYDENGNHRENVHGYRTYDDLKERYKALTGKEYDDSNITVPYDPNKEYKLPNGVVINQDLMKERYSGESPEKVKSDIEFEKKYLMNYNPKDREFHNAEIKEMEKYYDSMEKYESRISDDFNTSDWKEGYGNQFGEGSWKGSKSNSGLYGKDKIKAIDNEVRKAYPGLKTSRTTGRGGYTDSFSYSITESDKPIVRNINDFSEAEIDRLYDKGYNKNWYKTKDDFKQHLQRELESGHFSVNEYGIDDDYRLTPYGKQVFKDIKKVSDAYNYDESASQVDYFHTGHYLNLNVGKSEKPYKTTNETMNNAIREKVSNKYASAKHEGFGDYNKDNIPVYNNKIDYTGDFGRNANLSSLSNEELHEAIRVQQQKLDEANNEKIGDQRTRNGKMDKIFNTAKKQQYEQGVNLLKAEAIKRENDKYPQYKGTPAEVKYYSAEDVMKDPNSKMNQFIREEKQKKSYKKYLKTHPGSNLTFEEFKKGK